MKKLLLLLGVLIGILSLNAQVVDMDFEKVLLHGSSTIPDEKCVVFTVVGDGYTAAEQDTFMSLARDIVNSVANLAPFSTLGDKFKIYAIKVISEESGMGTTTPNNTFFQVFHAWGASSSSMYPSGEGKKRQAALLQRHAPETAITIIMVNKSQGVGGDCAVPSEATCCLSDPGIAFHEVAHAFANVGDEDDRPNNSRTERPNMSMESDSTQVRWRNFVGLEGIGMLHLPTYFQNYCPGGRCAVSTYINGRDLCLVCLAAATEMAAWHMGEPFYGTMYNGTAPLAVFQNKPLNTETAIAFPSGHERILDFAFHGCDRLQTLTIPNDVKTIGKYAFLKCTGLRTITNYRGNPQDIKSVTDPFQGVDRTAITLHVPAGTRAAYQAAGWTGFNIVEDLAACSGFTVAFNSKGGSQVAPYTCIIDDETVLAPKTPTRSGHAFGGWYQDSTYATAWNFATDKVTEDLTLYAKWQANIYKVAFNSQGGSFVDTLLVEYGHKITQPANPTKPSYGFYGWYREPLCTNLWNFETATVQNNLTLYAKWGEPSAVQDLLDAEQSESLKAWVQNGALHISGLIINQPFEIYTITGIPVYRGVVTSDVEAISCGSLPHGIYIIHQSNRSLKLNL